MSDSSQFSIVVASDNPIVRESLIHLLDGQGPFLVTGDSLEAPIGEMAADIVLCVIQPGANVESVLRANSTAYNKSKRFCLFLSTDYSQMIAALRGGAHGVVDDSLEDVSNIDDLIKGLVDVGSGGFFIPERIAKRLAFMHANVFTEFAAVPRDESLTKREQEVLSLLANGCGSREIALRLYLSEHTVRAHLRGIMQKLQVTSQAQAVAVAWKSKLVQSA